jgi:hypothetical protein
LLKIPNHCYDHCAYQQVENGFSMNGAFMDAACEGFTELHREYSHWSGNQYYTTCEVLQEKGSQTVWIQSLHDAHTRRRKLLIDRRLTEIQERRRLSQETGRCLSIDGRDFCSGEGVGSSRKLQEARDLAEARGYRYLVKSSGKQKKKMRKGSARRRLNSFKRSRSKRVRNSRRR